MGQRSIILQLRVGQDDPTSLRLVGSFSVLAQHQPDCGSSGQAVTA